MSTGNPLTNIIMAAADLKAVAPQMFGKFVEALRAYEAQAIIEAIGGDEPREIFRAQGRVKVIKSLRKNLQQCSELRATYERRGTNA